MLIVLCLLYTYLIAYLSFLYQTFCHRFTERIDIETVSISNISKNKKLRFLQSGQYRIYFKNKAQDHFLSKL